MTIQWHPLFTQLLRPVVEEYYEVVTDMPVGDMPRKADLVLLRRLSNKPTPYRGLWRHLSRWNILEYKGPTVSARLEDIDLLVELGLGIRRRLNHTQAKPAKSDVPAPEVAFWYLANSLGRRFREQARRRFGTLQLRDPGVFRARILGHHLYLVSARDLTVESESLPFHVLGGPADKEKEVARLVVENPSLWNHYADVFGSLHPDILQELEAMAKTSKTGPKFHLKPLADIIGWNEAIDQLGRDRIIELLLSEEESVKKIAAGLLNVSPSMRAHVRRQLDKAERPAKK